MSKPFARTILFACLAVVLLAALPAAAAPAQPAIAGPAVPAASPLTPNCNLDSPTTFVSPAPAVSTPALLPDWLAIDGSSSIKYHGYCPCGCSAIKNCNTNADCGGATCRPTISCC